MWPTLVWGRPVRLRWWPHMLCGCATLLSCFVVQHQALDKIPQPRSLVSSLPAPGRPELGPITVNGSALCYAASGVAGLPLIPSLPQPLSVTLFYAGPVRLVLINHAFDYRSVTECAPAQLWMRNVLRRHFGIQPVVF